MRELTVEVGGVVTRRLVFIHDDEMELRAFHEIVAGSYEYETVHWPKESAKLFGAAKPNLFVSDLYLPSSEGDRTPTDADRQAAARSAKAVGDAFPFCMQMVRSITNSDSKKQ